MPETVTPEKLEPSLKNLMTLKQDGMVECWILLSASDPGIRNDYPDYRKQHRDLLAGYLDLYILATISPSSRSRLEPQQTGHIPLSGLERELLNIESALQLPCSKTQIQ